MNRIWLALTLTLACTTPEEEPPVDAEAQFEALSAAFMEQWLERYPVSATQLGDHRYDDRWPTIGPHYPTQELAWLWTAKKELDSIPLDELGLDSQVDAAVLAANIEATAWETENLHPWATDPLLAVGTAGVGLDLLATRDFAPLPERMVSLEARLEGLPEFLAGARIHLAEPPEVHTRTAIDQTRALVAYVDGPIRQPFAGVPDQQADLHAAADLAAAALREHLSFLEEDLLPRSTGDFRLREGRYRAKLRHTLDTEMTAEEVAQAARDLLEQTTEEMAVLSVQLHPELFPGEPVPATTTEAERAALIRKVLDAIAEDHPTDETVIAEAEEALAEATAFVQEHQLVTLPTDPVRIVPMPEFRRGVAIAYCNASGPLEARRQTFYEIAPPPAAWSPARRESFYREYNDAMIRELTLHEAIPGHYLQLSHAAANPSVVRAVFRSGTFVEGWALYSEWVMTEAGFGGPRVRLQRDKLVLRLALNALLDQGVHMGDMEHDEAIALMVERGFQEEGEAEGKWTRAQLTSTQLSTYLVGLLEVMELRRDAEAHQGDAFDLGAFHDALLANGSVSTRHHRVLLGLKP